MFEPQSSKVPSVLKPSNRSGLPMRRIAKRQGQNVTASTTADPSKINKLSGDASAVTALKSFQGFDFGLPPSADQLTQAEARNAFSFGFDSSAESSNASGLAKQFSFGFGACEKKEPEDTSLVSTTSCPSFAFPKVSETETFTFTMPSVLGSKKLPQTDTIDTTTDLMQFPTESEPSKETTEDIDAPTSSSTEITESNTDQPEVIQPVEQPKEKIQSDQSLLLNQQTAKSPPNSQIVHQLETISLYLYVLMSLVFLAVAFQISFSIN